MSVLYWQQLVVRPAGSTFNEMRPKICVVRPNVQPRPSVKGAIQINVIIWSDFYCRIDLVASVK